MDSKHCHLIHLVIAILCTVPATYSAMPPFQLFEPAEPYCTPVVNETCDKQARYSRADGTCNNLYNPGYGSMGAPQIRYVKSDYDDGISSPRFTGADGQPLKGARFISNTLFKGDNPLDNRFTIMLMQWGQFIDHDITRSDPVDPVVDCNCDMAMNPPECLPIPIPMNDPAFGTQTCIDFKRSDPANTTGCSDTRQFPDSVTSYLDCSVIYGSSQEAQNSLRDNKKMALLKVSEYNQLPPDVPSQCRANHPTTYCFRAGDRDRPNEQPSLSVMHTVFLREHNRIAMKLQQINKHWNDEKVFQETRKIIQAFMQHITYKEFLQIVLSEDTIKKFKLQEKPKNYHYNKKINPAMDLAVSSAALRMGHTLVPDFFKRVKKNYAFISNLNLFDNFNDPIFLQSNPSAHYDELGRGLVDQRLQQADREIVAALRDRLFENNFDGKALDLPALNLQRSRDHGLPGYNKFRKLCSLEVGSDFNSLPDIPQGNRDLLKIAYSYADDIELFPGGLLETPSETSILGPTFNCLLGYQFAVLKHGDRFYWETRAKHVRFTRAQRRNIRKIKLSKILCNNLDFKTIQPEVFKAPSNRNKRKSCSKLPDLDLDPWKEEDPNSDSSSSSSSDSSSSSSSDSSSSSSSDSSSSSSSDSSSSSSSDSSSSSSSDSSSSSSSDSSSSSSSDSSSSSSSDSS